jgi:hypothetical protein
MVWRTYHEEYQAKLASISDLAFLGSAGEKELRARGQN